MTLIDYWKDKVSQYGLKGDDFIKIEWHKRITPEQLTEKLAQFEQNIKLHVV